MNNTTIIKSNSSLKLMDIIANSTNNISMVYTNDNIFFLNSNCAINNFYVNREAVGVEDFIDCINTIIKTEIYKRNTTYDYLIIYTDIQSMLQVESIVNSIIDNQGIFGGIIINYA